MTQSGFKLTYATMYEPPEDLHTSFERALEKCRANLGREYTMFIDGQERMAQEKCEDRSPIDTDLLLGVFQKGTQRDAFDAVRAARAAFPAWSSTPWRDRVAVIRRAADIIEERQFDIAAALVLEVGKSRMEALGDVAEAVDGIRYACDSMEEHNGFVTEMKRDPFANYRVTNTSMLRPYGVWAVISPFNFPFMLSAGPAGAALIAGNTVVLKPATDTPWNVRMLMECFRDAGLPRGVCNYVTGSGSVVGEALVNDPGIDGITFTGSYDLGMRVLRLFAQGSWPRPAILEMGGKNPVIVSKNADLERAALGIVRSAFGLQGQKCSACSRAYVEGTVFEKVSARIAELARQLVVGDPSRRDVFLGPVINGAAYGRYQSLAGELAQAGEILAGGFTVKDGDCARGFFCAPTVAARVPLSHRLWKHEMFLPMVMLHPVNGLEEAMRLANDVDYGLTAGFYGSREEAEWFFGQIQAGVAYANRPHGATTGAWPGYQPFGGWKGSGSTGKNAGGRYYLQLYMREQIHCIVE